MGGRVHTGTRAWFDKFPPDGIACNHRASSVCELSEATLDRGQILTQYQCIDESTHGVSGSLLVAMFSWKQQVPMKQKWGRWVSPHLTFWCSCITWTVNNVLSTCWYIGGRWRIRFTMQGYLPCLDFDTPEIICCGVAPVAAKRICGSGGIVVQQPAFVHPSVCPEHGVCLQTFWKNFHNLGWFT